MKYIREDGMVAVLVSPGHGHGWYTANLDHPELLFDSNIVSMLLDRRPDIEVRAYIETKYGADVWTGGLDTIVIRWVPQGSKFRVDEYDGHETLMLEHEHHWHIA